MPVAREGRAGVRECSAPGEAGRGPRRATSTPVLALLAATLTAQGCDAPGRVPDGAETRPAVERDHPAVVSLLPAASATLVALGLADAVVGRATDDRTAGLAAARPIGSVLAPSPEAIVAVAPDLIVGGTPAHTALLARLASTTGVNTLELSMDRLADVAPAVRMIGRSAGRGLLAARLARSIELELDSLAHQARALPAVRVLWVVGEDPPVLAGPGTLPSDLLALLGVLNVLADAPSAWPRPSFEALRARDPDVVVWPRGPGLGDPTRLPPSSPWRALAAVREGRVVRPDSELVHEPGPRVVEAARLLHRQLTPLRLSVLSRAPHPSGALP